MRLPFWHRRNKQQVGLVIAGEEICIPGYIPLDEVPEIVAGCRHVATLIGSVTIHLMTNTEKGDERIVNELSRMIDITPCPTMTRSNWMEYIIMTMLLYGRGNAVVLPHTREGLLEWLEPIAPSRVTFQARGASDYIVLIDGKAYDPQDVLHFVYNPDKTYPWRGQGLTTSLTDLAKNLTQATATKNTFFSSKWKPSVVIKVDADNEKLSSQQGRDKILKDYIDNNEVGKPWVIPAEQMDVVQVKPLSLADLAINDAVQIDKKTVAAIVQVPPYMVGAGDYDKDEYNQWIQGPVMALCKSIAEELTRKLILSPKWYLRMNVWSLLDFDLKTTSDVLLAGSDRGFVNGDEWRDRVNLPPAGLTEYKILENYIPYGLSGSQKKLTPADEQGG